MNAKFGTRKFEPENVGFVFIFFYNIRSERLVVSPEGLTAEGAESDGSWSSCCHSGRRKKWRFCCCCWVGFFCFVLTGRVDFRNGLKLGLCLGGIYGAWKLVASNWDYTFFDLFDKEDIFSPFYALKYNFSVPFSPFSVLRSLSRSYAKC